MSKWYSSSPTAYSPTDGTFSDKVATFNPHESTTHKEVARFQSDPTYASYYAGAGTADSDKIAQLKEHAQASQADTARHPARISGYEGLEVGLPPAIPWKSPKRQSYKNSDLIPLRDVAAAESPKFPAEIVRKPWYARRRNLLIIGLAILTLAVAAGVALGVVFGTRRKTNSPESSDATSPASGTNSSTTSAPPSVRSDSSIAAVSFVDESNTMQYRVYFQDPDNNIRESSYNVSGGKWYLSNPSVVKNAKPGSPLAAASLAPNDLAADKAGFGQAQSKLTRPMTGIYYLDQSNKIHELLTRDDGATWRDGSITGQNIVADKNSRLSAAFHSLSSCENCPNTRMLVYQDANGGLQLVNGTVGGTETQTYSLNTSAVDRTGLAMTLRWKADFIPGIRIYYQAKNGDAVGHWWEEPGNWAAQNVSSFSPALIPDTNGWQNRETSPMGTIPLVSELGIFTSPTTNGNSNPALMQALASPPGGSVTTIGWSGSQASGQWIPFASPPVFGAVRGGSKVDANTEGRWYLQGKEGGIREFYVDLDGENSLKQGVFWDGC
ncbi:MAG: hypothetical protein Q9160_003182 [Pyrenula sp. 1 TL-2023]